MFAETVTFPAAFLAGVLSFFSPCILPLIPAYFTFITGFSLEELTEKHDSELRRRVFISTFSYVLGFSFVFIVMGASASYLGSFIYKYRDVIRIIGGVLIIVFGAHLTGVISIGSLNVEKRFHMEKKPLHFLGTFIIGMAFGAGWSPCVGPLLGSILIIAGNQETVGHGVLLLGIYSAGLAIPFLIMSIFINFILVFLKKLKKFIKSLNLAAGVLLMLLGLSLVTDMLRF